MPDIFGTAAGTSAAIGDMAKLAYTQNEQLQTQKLAQTLQQQQGMSSIMQGVASGQDGKAPADPATQMEQAASLGLRAGYTDMASKLATAAAGLRLKKAQTLHAESQSTNQQFLAAKTELETVDKLLGNVNNQESWDAANNLFQTITGRKSPFAGTDYHPELVRQIQEQTLSLKDKLDLQIKQYNSQTSRMNAEGANSFRSFRENYLTQTLGIAREREDRLQKAAGMFSTAPAPLKSELDAATGIVKEAYPDLPDSEVDNAARNVATYASAMQKATPGLDQKTAMQRALADAKELGILNQTYGSANATQADQENMANQVALARTGLPRTQIVGGWGKEAGARWTQIESQAIQQIMEENPGMSRQDAARQFANEQIGLHARGQSIGQLTKMQGATQQAVAQLEYNVQQTTRVLQNIPSSDFLPVLNALARGEEKWTGDPRYSELFYYMNSVATESARILSGGQASVAQLRQGAADEAKNWANANMTPKQFIEGTAPAILSEGRARLKTYQDAIDQQKTGTPLPGQGPNKQVNKPPLPPLTNEQGWTLHSDKNGNMAYVSPDGKQFKEVK